jgi:hypothetical protein
MQQEAHILHGIEERDGALASCPGGAAAVGAAGHRQ